MHQKGQLIVSNELMLDEFPQFSSFLTVESEAAVQEFHAIDRYFYVIWDLVGAIRDISSQFVVSLTEEWV